MSGITPLAAAAAVRPRPTAAVRGENIEDLYALSPVQQGMLFHALLAPGPSPYLEQGVWTLTGAIDLGRFERAWNLLIERHPMLRTVFHEARQQPIQIVLKRLAVSLPVCDLSALPPAAGRSACAAFLAGDLKQPIDPRTGPLVRGVLFRLSGEETRFVFTFDHAILDGWSLPLLSTDLLALYEALTRGVAPPAVDAPPYKDFVVWLSRWDRREALDFWTRYLAGWKTPTPLPLDRRPAKDGERSLVSLAHRLAASTSQRLAALARERRVTLGALVQAAWAILLSRYGGLEAVVFGLTVSGRPPELPASDRIVGPFINTLPVRVQVDEEAAFLDLPRALMQHYTDLSRHGYLSLPDVQAQSEITPPAQLFDSILIFHNEAQERAFSSPHLQLVVEDPPVERTSYQLTIDVLPGQRMQVKISYPRQVFDAATVERLMACFERLLESVASRPEARIAELEILPEAERERLLVGFNRTGAGVGGERPFSALFAERVAAQPEAVAAACGGEQVSYAGLAARAAAVASLLRARGAGPEVRVGVFGERGIGMLATIIGILEAGAAWVPLEPAHPDRRLSAILEDSGVGLVATQARLAARAVRLSHGQVPAPEVFCWDEPLDEPPGAPGAALPRTAATAAAGGHLLAYVFYTSGSTGVPKGAMVEQAGMLNHLWAKIALLGLGPASGVVQNAAHGFDISVWQMLAPLLAGGRVLIVDDETALDPGLLLPWVERSGATVLETVPTLLEPLLLAAGKETRLPRLTYLISNAETLPVGLCRRWLERFPRVPLINTYGATECSDDTTHQVFLTAPPAESVRVGVGRPIPGLRIYVLDRRLRPVPLGCAGQIAMAGAGVGRGYLGAPRKTAETFVPDPFGEQGGRLYLSGDLGRWTEAGELDLLGRLDSQVKVRGQRIELGEVEAALARHPAVRQAVVVARPDGQGGQRLVAYLVAEGEPSPGELHDFLARSLPRPMLPERFVELAALPLNRNGKVDRQALPEPSAEPEREGYVAPRTALETAIAALWQSVLGIERVGVHDDFFDLGGHSLKAIQLATQMKARLGSEVSVRDLFLAPTVAGLAAVAEKSGNPLAAAAGGAAGPPRPAIPRGPDLPRYPLSIAQSAQWFAAQMSDAPKPAEILKLEGPVDRRALRSAIGRLVDRHEALRTAFAEFEGEPAQTIHETVAMDCPEEDLSRLDEAARTRQVRLLLREAARPFDLGQPPLLRARLLRLEEESHLLLLNLPHIVSDGWSEQLLLRELAESYNAFRAGLNPPLSLLPLRLVDVAAWQHEQLTTPALTAQRDFWLERFRDRGPTLLFPKEGPSSPAPQALATAPGPAFATLVLSRELSRKIKQLSSSRGATLFMVVLAAFKMLLARWTGQTDLVVGSVLAGRNHADLEGLVGVFINTLALRSDLSGNPAFSTVLARVRRTTLEAIAHQDYPFHGWLETLRRERRQSDYLPFSALFVLHQKPSLAAFDGLAASYVLHHEITGDTPLLGDRVPGSASGQMLRLDAIESEDSLQLMLCSGSGRPPGAALERLLGQLRSILDQAASHPEMPSSELLGDGLEQRQAFATVELAASDLVELFGTASGRER